MTCPSERFSATFAAAIDQTADTPFLIHDDPELISFRNKMKLKEDEIQHVFDVASFGLDFSVSAPNEQHECLFENAKMSPIISTTL